MAVSTVSTSRTSRRPVPVGITRLIVAGERLEPLALPDVLATAVRARPAVVVVDLTRRAFVVVPCAGGGDTRLVVSGEVDLATVPMLGASLDAALAGRPAVVSLDLSGVTFLDVRGAGLLSSAAGRAREWGGTVAVRNARPAVRRTLEVCGLRGLLGPRAGASPGTGARAGRVA